MHSTPDILSNELDYPLLLVSWEFLFNRITKESPWDYELQLLGHLYFPSRPWTLTFGTPFGIFSFTGVGLYSWTNNPDCHVPNFSLKSRHCSDENYQLVCKLAGTTEA